MIIIFVHTDSRWLDTSQEYIYMICLGYIDDNAYSEFAGRVVTVVRNITRIIPSRCVFNAFCEIANSIEN